MEHTQKRKTSKEKIGRERLYTVVALALLLLFGLFINRHLKIKALYGDDLYLWSFYGCQDFWSYTFPKVTKGNFRPFYWAVSYLEFLLIGPHVEWYATFNVLLNVLISWVIYFFSRRLSHLSRVPHGVLLRQGVGLLTGGLYLQSHFAAYQIAQVLGLLESLALLLALLTLWALFDYMEGRGTRAYLYACLSFFLVMFTHERYIALAPLFYLAIFTVLLTERRIRKRFEGTERHTEEKSYKEGTSRSRRHASERQESMQVNRWELLLKLLAPVLMLAVFFAVRMTVAGEAIPVGTAGTKVQDTFSLTQAIGYAFTQVAYIFGINAGHAIFCGVSFAESPRWVHLLIYGSWLCLLLMVVIYLRSAWLRGRITARLIGENLLFIAFIALCIGSSSITIRLETRWVYVSYTAALLYLSYMLGEIAKEKGVRGPLIAFTALFLAYGAVMTPVEHFDRQHYYNIFFFFDQDRVNSLADCTIGAEGAENFLGKKQVYIFYNYYEMTEFYAEYFFKPFDPEKTGQGTEIHFINSPAALPEDATDENSIVLMEHGNRGYIDVTAQAFGKAGWETLAQA